MTETHTAKPRPAAGHIYRTTAGDLLTLGEEAPTSPGFFRVNDGWMRAVYYIETGAWTLVGISTPAGRVMVGERRAQPGLETMTRVVLTILDDEDVRMGWPDGPESGVYFAADVAAWPLLPATVPLAPAARGACLDRYATREDVAALPAVTVDWAWDPGGDPAVLETVRAVVAEYAAKRCPAVVDAARTSSVRDLLAVNARRSRDSLPALAALGPGIATLPLTPARVAVEVEGLPERWQRWGLP